MPQPVLDRETILHAIEQWSHEDQLALAHDIERIARAPRSRKPHTSFMSARGIMLTPGKPAPTDEDIERWRTEKYGDLG